MASSMKNPTPPASKFALLTTWPNQVYCRKNWRVKKSEAVVTVLVAAATVASVVGFVMVFSI